MFLSERDNNLNNTDGPEYRSNGLLDDDFLKVFEPYRNVQKLLGSCRVDVKGRCVTQPTTLQKCYTAIWVVLMIISLFQLILTYTTRFSDNRKLIYLWFAGIAAVLVVFTGCIIHARYYDNEGNVDLYIQMQQIDRLMRTNRNLNSMHFKHNQRTAYSLAIFFIIVLGLSYIIGGDHFGILELVGSTYTLETFVIELSCCSSHITFFYTRMRQVNSIITNHIVSLTCNIAVLSVGTKSGERHIKMSMSSDSQTFEAIDTDIYMKEIFRCFVIFKEQYKFQIFSFFAVLIAWILFTFEHGVLTLQSNYTDKSLFLVDFLFLLSLTFIELLLLLVLCLGSEVFTREVRQTKHLAILLMCRYVDGPSRTKAKNMLVMIQEMPSFSVYGMWTMDAQLLIDIFKIVTNLIVILIQFTFL